MYNYLFIGETKIVLYNFLGLIGYIVLLVFNYSRFKYNRTLVGYRFVGLAERCSNKKMRSFLMNTFTFLHILIMSVLIYISSFANVPFGNLVGTGGNYFAELFLVPFVWILVSFLIGTNPLKNMDSFAFAIPLRLTFSKLGCFCSGCCRGIEWEHGLYNTNTEAYEVPVQLIEVFWAFSIFILLVKNKNKLKEGTVLPIYMILFSATRFFSEFLRTEENVFLIFKTYQILCVIGVALGILLLCIVNKNRDKIDSYYDKKYEKINLKSTIKETVQ